MGGPSALSPSAVPRREYGVTLSTVAAGSEDVDNTRERELTEVSPELVGSTVLNDCWYIAGTVASAYVGLIG